jgi:hypothetical protein
MPGLDPGIHDAVRRIPTLRLYALKGIMDCRVKPGNDDGEERASGKAQRGKRNPRIPC